MVGYKPIGTVPQSDQTVIKTGEGDGKGGPVSSPVSAGCSASVLNAESAGLHVNAGIAFDRHSVITATTDSAANFSVAR